MWRRLWGRQLRDPRTLRLKTPSKKSGMPVIKTDEVFNNIRTCIKQVINIIEDPQMKTTDKALEALRESLYMKLRYINEHGNNISEEKVLHLLSEIRQDERRIRELADKNENVIIIKHVLEALVAIGRLLPQ
ncbi:hypothetical protein [Ectobacillus panaciterrae]|uniref:hypothetical protein n=1 Tax=Ectobacillus panaciterrae TaxID=363872 RepID=UPI0003FCB032|nr:hypothetical protein [Ectobacillus panaciterrae]